MALNTVLLVAACLYLGVQGALRMPHYYTNHMVLQRAPERAIVWGYADVIGDTVRVMKNGVQVGSTIVQRSNTSASLGIWKVKLPPESNAGPFEIQVTSSEGTVSLSDVMFGDVWICSGQSNMQFKMSEVHDSIKEIEDSVQYSNIRMIFSNLHKSSVPLEDVALMHPWIYPIKGIINNFSALCFMFARDLQKDLNYPIGLVESNWGGTPIEVWSSPSAINTCPTSVRPAPSQWWPTERGALWNSMIHPYLPMTIKGAIWYQGESNAGHPDLYACQFPAMIDDWRKQFHAASDGETSENFPFGFVQLAPNRDGDSLIGGFPPTRWAQTKAVGYVPNSKMPNTFMAVAIDLPDFNSSSGSIHPTYKQDVAARLVLGARNVAYGEHDVIFQGPFPTSFMLNPDQKALTIEFDNGTGVLQVKNNKGFEICCASSTSACNNAASWLTAPIKTPVRSNHIVDIDVSNCHGNSHVVGVRYLWRESPCPLNQCALYGSQSQLPVPPFTKTEQFQSTGNAPCEPNATAKPPWPNGYFNRSTSYNIAYHKEAAILTTFTRVGVAIYFGEIIFLL